MFRVAHHWVCMDLWLERFKIFLLFFAITVDLCKFRHLKKYWLFLILMYYSEMLKCGCFGKKER